MRDAELMLRVRAGDEGAFRELMERFGGPLLGFYRRLGMGEEDARDGVQEVFLRLYRSRREYVPRAELRHLVYRIATNYWIDRVRRVKRRPGTVSLDAPLGREASRRPATLKDQLAGGDPGPGALLANEELGRRIEAAIGRLPEAQRVVFLLGGRAGIRYAEIAEMLGIPVGTVKSRMHGAVHFLRRLLRKEHGADGP